MAYNKVFMNPQRMNDYKQSIVGFINKLYHTLIFSKKNILLPTVKYKVYTKPIFISNYKNPEYLMITEKI